MAIDPGQMEAGPSIGLSPAQSYRRIVLPQALLVAVPSLGSFLIGLLKDTSLLSFISVTELMKTGNDIVATTFLAFQVYILVGIIYSLINVRSPAPPLIALLGLLGMLIGEQAIPSARQLLGYSVRPTLSHQTSGTGRLFGTRSDHAVLQADRGLVGNEEEHS